MLVTLHAIIRRSFLEMDDALADKIEPGATVDQLQAEDVRARLESRAETSFSQCEEAGRP